MFFEFAATRLQAKYKGYKAKGEFKKQKEAGKLHSACYYYINKGKLHTIQIQMCISLATKIETCWRGVQARKERDKRAWAVKVIKK